MSKKKKQLIKYRAVKVVGKPIKIMFRTKRGEKVYFEAIKGVEEPDPMKMQTPELIKFLKETGFTELAKVLKKLKSLEDKQK